MMENNSPRGFGTGPGAPGFSGAYGISAVITADTAEDRSGNDCSNSADNGVVMKTAEIDWQLFWQAASQQTTEGKKSWLLRWAFADDSVWLSMRR
jgi:hypothetical protein